MIEPDLRAFLEGGVGIHIGSRTAAPRAERRAGHRGQGRGRPPASLAYVPEVAAGRVVPDLAGQRRRGRRVRPPDRRSRVPDQGHLRRRPAGARRRAPLSSNSSGTRSWPVSRRSASRDVGASGWIIVAVGGRSGCAPRPSSTRRPGPQAGALLVRDHERSARIARHVLPGPAAGAALHLLGGRHAECGVPQSRGLRRFDARGAVLPVLQQEPAQHHREPAGAR